MEYINDDNAPPIGTTRASELDEQDGRERLRDKGHDVKAQMKSKAQDLAEMTMERARSKGEQQKARATDEIEMLANALHDAGSTLDRDNAISGRFIHAAADRLQDISTRLDGRDVDGLVRESRQWARRNPAAFLGGAVAVGFLASRFFKASPDDEWEEHGNHESASSSGSVELSDRESRDRSMERSNPATSGSLTGRA